MVEGRGTGLIHDNVNDSEDDNDDDNYTLYRLSVKLVGYSESDPNCGKLC